MLVDKDNILQVIAGDLSVGVDLQDNADDSALYYRLRDLRSTARTNERKAMQDGEPVVINPTDWHELMNEISDVLINKSKNLELACWLCEALVRIDGFKGLQLGFDILAGLLEKYWPQVYPNDGDDIEFKLSTLAGLNGDGNNGTLILPIQCINLTQGDNAYSLWQYEQASLIATITDEEKRQSRIDSGAICLEQIEASVLQTPLQSLINLDQALQDCCDSYAVLSRLLAEKCAELAPPTSQISAALSQCTTVLQAFIKQKNASMAQVEASNSSGVDDKQTVSLAAMSNRTHALAQLQKVANYFRENEPHSPISYTLERTIRWGNMPLDELVEEMFLDPNAQLMYCKMVGINPPSEPMVVSGEGELSNESWQ